MKGLFKILEIWLTSRKEITYLSQFINEDRLSRIDEVLGSRTKHLTVVLEDIHKAHNANAVLRSCDGFGVQDVHIIENKNRFANPYLNLFYHVYLKPRR